MAWSFWESFHDNPWMASSMHNRWVSRGVAFLLWALVAASASYWALRLNRDPGRVVPPIAVPAAVIDPAAVARVMGHLPQTASTPSAALAPNLASRFVLTGVVAGRSGGGAALIAVDGRAPKPFRVGRAVDDGLVLKAVEGRSAVLAASANGPDLAVLEMPALSR